MSNNDDFWTTLATGHTNTVLSGAMDSHLSGKSLEESFGSVRDLTDKMRAANALSLPVEAGTKVVFAGGMGAYLAYDDIPADGIGGEVVTVKSATGEITHHDGKVFVKWADGKFRPIHAEHLRLAGQGRHASEIKADFDKVKALAEKRPDSKFLKDLLKQMADKGFTPTDKQMKVVKEIEDEIKQQAEMQKELAGLDKKKAFDPKIVAEAVGTGALISDDMVKHKDKAVRVLVANTAWSRSPISVEVFTARQPRWSPPCSTSNHRASSRAWTSSRPRSPSTSTIVNIAARKST